jgi:hypothetical protein
LAVHQEQAAQVALERSAIMAVLGAHRLMPGGAVLVAAARAAKMGREKLAAQVGLAAPTTEAAVVAEMAAEVQLPDRCQAVRQVGKVAQHRTAPQEALVAALLPTALMAPMVQAAVAAAEV